MNCVRLDGHSAVLSRELRISPLCLYGCNKVRSRANLWLVSINVFIPTRLTNVQRTLGLQFPYLRDDFLLRGSDFLDANGAESLNLFV